jgi:NTP pyrophosphatase (non-canonical NTP hydrolase)
MGKIKTQDPELLTVAKYIRQNDFLSVLMEEVGEVASACQGDGDLVEELIQVASVAIRWLEQIKEPTN